MTKFIIMVLSMIAFSSQAAEVVIIDRFYDFDDPAFVSVSPDPSLQDHGTRISKIITKLSPNTTMVKKVAHNNPQLIEVLDELNEPNRTVINLSFGHVKLYPCPSSLQDSINSAILKGAIFVVAAGNNGSAELTTPANCDNVIVVGAQENKQIANYSNHSEQVSIYAPEPSLGFFSFSMKGTSFTAPVITSVIANILNDSPEMTLDEIKNKLNDMVDINKIATFESLNLK